MSLGENVSTADVEAVIQKVTQLSDCVVFGVEVFGCEGKAGMAVIATDSTALDLNRFGEDMRRQLPNFAIPVFLRLTDSIDITGSYKLIKNDFVRTGYSLDSSLDPIYFYDNYDTKAYIPLNPQLYEDITSGRIKI